MVRRSRRAILGIGTLALAACVTGQATTVRGTSSDAVWADSVLATLSLRDKAAQMVWPWILGDYTAVDNAAWTRVERMIREQKLGGAIISVGGPIDIAVKTNALQRAATLPLLIGADLETGAAFRARGGYFIPNAIDLGGATAFPYQMGLGATRDTTLAYEMGRVTALEGRALGIHMAFAPVLDVNNNPKNPVIAARSFGERTAARRTHGPVASFAAFRKTECSPRRSISPVMATPSRTRISSWRASMHPARDSTASSCCPSARPSRRASAA